ncbi:hypothetical protein ACJX0J_013317, partial [Zea mays]
MLAATTHKKGSRRWIREKREDSLLWITAELLHWLRYPYLIPGKNLPTICQSCFNIDVELYALSEYMRKKMALGEYG